MEKNCEKKRRKNVLSKLSNSNCEKFQKLKMGEKLEIGQNLEM